MSRLLTLKKYLVFLVSSLFCVGGCLLIFFQPKSFADSTSLSATIQIPPVITCTGGNGYQYNGDTSACYTQLSGSGATVINAATHPTSNPLQTQSITNQPYQAVQVDGDYLIVATFEFKQSGNAPVYYWVEDWVLNNVDYSKTTVTQNQRVFYSGDNPQVLNVGDTKSALAYYSGIVHLKAGAQIYYPMIWAATNTGVYGAMTYTSDTQCAAGAGKCHCSDASWTQGGTCFFVTLLSSP